MDDLMQWWRLYLPAELRDVAPERPAGTDLAIWRHESGGMLLSYGFQGNARKPVWHFRFRNAEQREEFIANKIAMRKAHFSRKAERASARKNAAHSLVVGDILSASWGYDQTNVDFYEVVDVPGPKSVVLRQIAQAAATSDDRNGDKVMPEKGNFVGGPLLKRVNEHGYVRVTDCSIASKWSGQPMYQTSAYAGH